MVSFVLFVRPSIITLLVYYVYSMFLVKFNVLFNLCSLCTTIINNKIIIARHGIVHGGYYSSLGKNLMFAVVGLSGYKKNLCQVLYRFIVINFVILI